MTIKRFQCNPIPSHIPIFSGLRSRIIVTFSLLQITAYVPDINLLLPFGCSFPIRIEIKTFCPLYKCAFGRSPWFIHERKTKLLIESFARILICNVLLLVTMSKVRPPSSVCPNQVCSKLVKMRGFCRICAHAQSRRGNQLHRKE